MRVWVTGTGTTCALGATSSEMFERLVRGDRALSEIDLFDTSDQRARVGGQVRGVVVPSGHEWSRASAFALMAAREALAEARIDPKRTRVGLVVGGTTAGMFEDELRVAAMMANKRPRRPEQEMRSHPLSSTLDALHEEIGPFCRLRTVASACSSGATALWLGLSWLLANDDIDVVLAGGTDGLCRLTVTGFNALTAMDPELCKPFGRSRRGMNLGEGAGFLVLERATDANRRGAIPIAELGGVAVGAEAHHITNPEPTGARAAQLITRALERARVTPDMLDYVNAHGTATPLNDVMEAKALALALGDQLERVFVSSSKAQIGHTLGAAGAIEAVISALALKSGVLPPTAGLADVDPECAALRHLFEAKKLDRVRAVVSSSFGFGGMDGAVVLTQPELCAEAPSRTVSRVVITGGSALGPRGLVTSRDAPSLASGSPSSGRVVDTSSTLDPARARRLDRAGKLATIVTQAALREAGAEGALGENFGVVMGSGYSAVDDCGAFMRRIAEKGPRLASPADFPNLVPSSPIGHASIYLRLFGAPLATAELQASAESAIATAIEVIAAGEAASMVAGACPVGSDLIDEAFAPLFSDGTEDAARAEGAAAVALESEATAEARGARPLCVVESCVISIGETLVLAAPRDPSRARVVSRSTACARACISGTSWEPVQTTSVAPGAGDSDAASGLAVIAAIGLLASADSETDEVLMVGSRPGPGKATTRYHLHLRRP